MPADQPENVIVSEQMELYLARDANAMVDVLSDDPEYTDEDLHPPAYGLRLSKSVQNGIGEFTTENIPFAHFAMVEPGHEDEPFCLHQAVDQFEDVAEWFDRESLYDYDERGEIIEYSYDVPMDVTLESTNGVTVVLDYVENTETADNQSLRARLFYGGPWNDSENQYLAFTVFTKHLPESYEEVGEVLEFMFRHEPVQQIPLCIFDDADTENTDHKDTENTDNTNNGTIA